MKQETSEHPAMAGVIRMFDTGAGNRGILLIAIFDLVKAMLFLVAAVGIFHLVDRNTHVELTRLLHAFRFNGDHALVKDLLLKADVITDPDKRILTEVLLLYAGMYTVEGVGLLLRKRWAEYFAVVMTVIPLPFEVHTLFHHATRPLLDNQPPPGPLTPVLLQSQVFVLKCAVLLINVGIVWYLIYHLRRNAKQEKAAPITRS